ncbi:unnamed protein product [Umbelopsis vinacea]
MEKPALTPRTPSSNADKLPLCNWRQFASVDTNVLNKPAIHPVAVPNTPMTPLTLEDRILANETGTGLRVIEGSGVISLATQVDYFGYRERHMCQ